MDDNRLWEAMAHLDPALINEADRPARRPRRLRPVLAAAICAVLAVGALAAGGLLGFDGFRHTDDGVTESWTMTPSGTIAFPKAQFSGAAREAMEGGSGTLEFDTWDEAAAFVGKDIPLASLGKTLTGGQDGRIRVMAESFYVGVIAQSVVDGCRVGLVANIDVEGAESHETGVVTKSGRDVESRTVALGSGGDALVYTVDGEWPYCVAYFIRDGIYYNLTVDGTADSVVLEALLAEF